MREAWLNRTPFVVEGLEPETGDAEVTDRNCRKLVSPGRQVSGIHNWNGSVLIVWSTGELYAALGYSIGRDDDGCRLLANFLAENAEGRWTTDADLLQGVLADLPQDLNGDVPLLE